MADQWREPINGSVTARMLLQQPIPVFDRVRKLGRSSVDFFKILGVSAHCRADDPRIIARGSMYCRAATFGKPTRCVRGKGKFSVSRTVVLQFCG